MLAPLALAIVTTVLAFGYPRFRYAADVGLIVLAGCALARVRVATVYAAARRRSALSRT
jgi:hypothetical protein